MHLGYLLSLFVSLAAAVPVDSNAECRCIPGQPCWPSVLTWTKFNKTISGQLIHALPVAASCYLGPNANEAACKLANAGFANATYESAQPLGFAYPLNSTCPSIPFGNATSKECTQGSWPVFAVNVTSEDTISKTVKFAAKNNLRLSVKSTGHDFLQRSTGDGSLSVWMRNWRKGFEFYDHNVVAKTCPASSWTGSTLRITGSYAWSDIYPIANKKGVIVAGGNSVGPSSTGGWMQGGGHSPVTNKYGMGAEQVLSLRVVLASGTIVTASPCENQDLFFAIRGGGGGTYGVVIETIVKTYPTMRVDTVDLVIGSVGEANVSPFLDAVASMYGAFPQLSKAGFSGYGYWNAHLSKPLTPGSPYTNSLSHTFNHLGGSAAKTKELFRSFAEEIMAFNNTKRGVFVSLNYTSFPDYGSYYLSKTDTDNPVGGVSAMTSRLLDSKSLTSNAANLRKALGTLAGSAGKPIFHTLVHHGLGTITPQHQDSPAAIQPGWYKSIILNIAERQVVGLEVDDNLPVFADIRGKIAPLFQKLSPDTGTYMNEADWGETMWQKDFYGDNWGELSEVKSKYDANGLFYCQTCVGSQKWFINDTGALCKASYVS